MSDVDIIFNPSFKDKRSYGVLAYVSAADRKRIMLMPKADRVREIAKVEALVKKIIKRRY